MMHLMIIIDPDPVHRAKISEILRHAYHKGSYEGSSPEDLHRLMHLPCPGMTTSVFLGNMELMGADTMRAMQIARGIDEGCRLYAAAATPESRSLQMSLGCKGYERDPEYQAFRAQEAMWEERLRQPPMRNPAPGARGKKKRASRAATAG